MPYSISKLYINREMNVRNAKPHPGPMYSPDLDHTGTRHFRPRRDLEHGPGAVGPRNAVPRPSALVNATGRPGPRWTNFARIDPEPV